MNKSLGPFEGGPAVYEAAAIAELLNDSINFYYDEVCNQNGYFRLSKNIEKEKSAKVKIIPNPASDKINIVIEGQAGGLCLVSIFDAIGKKQSEYRFNCKIKNFSIDVKNLNPGIYSIRTLIDNQKPCFNKVTIVR